MTLIKQNKVCSMGMESDEVDAYNEKVRELEEVELQRECLDTAESLQDCD